MTAQWVGEQAEKTATPGGSAWLSPLTGDVLTVNENHPEEPTDLCNSKPVHSFHCRFGEPLVPKSIWGMWHKSTLSGGKKSNELFFFKSGKKSLTSLYVCALTSPAGTGAVQAGDSSLCHRTLPQFSGHLSAYLYCRFKLLPWFSALSVNLRPLLSPQ